MHQCWWWEDSKFVYPQRNLLSTRLCQNLWEWCRNGHATQCLDDQVVIHSWISHFIGTLRKSTKIDEKNRHLLLLDGHNSYVTLEIVTSAMNFGLDIISLPSHISHVLQPLNVNWFKPIKSAFRQILDYWMLLNKGKKVEKTTLCEWTSQALERPFTPNNIKSGFQRTGIWPLDDTAATNRMEYSKKFEEGDQEIQPLSE